MSNDKIIWDFLKNKNLSDQSVGGLMGNLFAESALIPNNVQGSYLKSNQSQYNAEYTKKVDKGEINFSQDKTGGGGYGLI